MKSSVVQEELAVDDFRFFNCKAPENYDFLTKVLQCSIDAFQLQGFVNLKNLADLEKSPIQELARNPRIFVQGYGSRLAYKTQ